MTDARPNHLATPLHNKSEKLISTKLLMPANEILDTGLLLQIVRLHVNESSLEGLLTQSSGSNADSFRHGGPLAQVSNCLSIVETQYHSLLPPLFRISKGSIAVLKVTI